MRSNNIGGKGLCALSDAMKLNQTLTHIFIWGNRLEESAAIVSTVKPKRFQLQYSKYSQIRNKGLSSRRGKIGPVKSYFRNVGI